MEATDSNSDHPLLGPFEAVPSPSSVLGSASCVATICVKKHVILDSFPCTRRKLALGSGEIKLTGLASNSLAQVAPTSKSRSPLVGQPQKSFRPRSSACPSLRSGDMNADSALVELTDHNDSTEEASP